MCGCTNAENGQYFYVEICSEANGLSPEDVESKITIPLENIIGKVKSIHSINSASFAGRSRVSVSFPVNLGESVALSLIKEKINTSSIEFPEMNSKPEIFVLKNGESDSEKCS